MNGNRYLLLAVLLMAVAGCSSTPQTRQLLDAPPDQLTPVKELTDVPFFPQTAYQCGPAALATVLAHSELDVVPDDLTAKVYVEQRKGTFQVEMLAASRGLGRVPLKIEPTMASIFEWVDAGEPVLVLQNLGLDWFPKWHYAVVVGYDLQEGEMVLRSGTIERYQVAMNVFERTWRRADHWGFVALQSGDLPLAQNESMYFLAVAGFERNASPDDQRKAWKAGLAAWPDSAKMRMGYGNFLYRTDQKSEAASVYRQTIELDPTYGPAYNNLAQLKIEQNAFDEAIELLETAIAIDPNKRTMYQKTLDSARRLQHDLQTR